MSDQTVIFTKDAPAGKVDLPVAKSFHVGSLAN
jgi:hypothetical protein